LLFQLSLVSGVDIHHHKHGRNGLLQFDAASLLGWRTSERDLTARATFIRSSAVDVRTAAGCAEPIFHYPERPKDLLTMEPLKDWP